MYIQYAIRVNPIYLYKGNICINDSCFIYEFKDVSNLKSYDLTSRPRDGAKRDENYVCHCICYTFGKWNKISLFLK